MISKNINPCSGRISLTKMKHGSFKHPNKEQVKELHMYSSEERQNYNRRFNASEAEMDQEA